MKEVCRLSIVYEVDDNLVDDPKDKNNVVRHRIEFIELVRDLFSRVPDALSESEKD